MNKNIVDNPELMEVFINSVGRWGVHERHATLEFCVSRPVLADKEGGVAMKKHLASRLVLTPTAIIELASALTSIIDVMKKEGLIKEMPIPKFNGILQ
jgi:hypothetical protein